MIDITSYLLGKEAGGGGGGGSPEDVAAAYNACSGKGATLPQEQTLANLADCIETIPSAEVIPPDAGTLTSIVVGTFPQTTYTEGDALNLTGMVILANYSNGGQFDVTQRCVITANDPVQYTDTKIVVSYTDGGVTATLDILLIVNGLPVQAPASTVALYHFDNDTKNAVTGQGATSTGPTSYINGKFSYAIQNPTSGALNKWAKISSTENYNINMSVGNHTFEFWAKSGAQTYLDSSAPYIWSENAGLFNTANYSSVGIQLSYQTNTAVYKPASSWDAREWHHYAIVFIDGAFSIYVDGALWTTGTITNTTYCTMTVIYARNGGKWDEMLVCNEAKYLAPFELPHGPYYIAE